MVTLETNQSLIYLILKNKGNSSITGIVKTCYLIDLSYKEKHEKKISDFVYMRYYYWPYSREIPETIDSLITSGTLESEVSINTFWDEQVTYSLKKWLKEEIGLWLDKKEIIFALNMIKELAPFNASDLTKISYNIGPLKKMWAKLGGQENFKKIIL